MSTPQYGPTVKPGDVRRRVWRVGIENPIGGVPGVTFHEEEIIHRVDGVEQSLGRTRDLQVTYVPGTFLPLLDPVTGEPTGHTISHDVVFAAMYSLGRATQNAADVVADAAVASEPAP